MTDKYLLGIDVGTNGSKGVITDLNGRVLADRTTEHSTSSPQPGWYEHDADRIWWAGVVQIIRQMLADSGVDPKAIAGIGVSALGPDVLPVDEAGRPLRPAILYGIDTRAFAEIDWIKQRFGARYIFERTGTELSAQSMTPKILWLKRHEPEIYARTRKMHTASGYLIFKLTGEDVIDYGTGMSFSPAIDVATLQVDEEIFRAMGIEPELMPRPAFTTDVAGEVTAAAAAETGLAVGTPVIAGCMDGNAEAVSVGAMEPGDAALTYGSTMCLVLSLQGAHSHPSLFSGPNVERGAYVMAAATATSASITRWFRDNFAPVELDGQLHGGPNAYQQLSEAAATVPPGAEGLLMLPYFAGERTPLWDSQARGLIVGLTLAHSRAHVYRAILEATALSLRHNIDEMRQAGVEIKRIVSTGGGTRSRLWTQIISDVTGYPQELAESPYGSPYGGAYLAGRAVGLFKDYEPLRNQWVKIVRRIEPNPRLKPLYDRYYAIYRNVYTHVKEDMHALADLARRSPDEC